MKRRLTWQLYLYLLFLLLLAVGGKWERRFSNIPHYIIPKLSDVFVSMWENSELLGKHFVITLGEALLGLGYFRVFGTLAAIWIESSGLARKTIYPLIVASQTIPIIALSPIMVMWFGYEIWSKVAVVILFTFFPIAMNTADGSARQILDIGELMQTMGAGKARFFLEVENPVCASGFFHGT